MKYRIKIKYTLSPFEGTVEYEQDYYVTTDGSQDSETIGKYLAWHLGGELVEMIAED